MNNMRNKILMTLALLITAVTGAWADETPLLTIESKNYTSFTSGSKTFDNIATVTFSSGVANDGNEWGWYHLTGVTLTVTPVEGITITRVKFTCKGGSAFDETAPFEAVLGDPWYNPYMLVNGTSYGEYGVTKIEVYGTAEPPLEVTWDAATKTGTFTMPAYDVEIAPIYAPVAKWATEGDAVLAPTAIEGIFAGTTDAIVKAGTVVEGQGTAMYFATTEQLTAEQAAAADGWLSTLPTAAGYDGAQTVYVWYYIKGADTPDGQTATAENTFNDLEICATPLKVEVLSNKFDIALKAANANTIESGKATVKVGETAATVTDGKIEKVKMGSKVTITAKDGYKFRKAEATKTVNMLYIEASNHKLYYMEGETWRQAINNHTDLNQGWQYGGMEVWFGNIVNVLKGNGAAVDPGSVIDPTKTYTL